MTTPLHSKWQCAILFIYCSYFTVEMCYRVCSSYFTVQDEHCVRNRIIRVWSSTLPSFRGSSHVTGENRLLLQKKVRAYSMNN